MRYKKFNDKYIIRIDKGEEIVETLKNFCQKENIKLGYLTGIGAANQLVIGFFETGTKEYHQQEFKGDFEIAPLVGNISTMKGEVYLHLHINIAGQDNNSYAGHLNKAVVSATFEAVLHKIEGEVEREFSDQIGLNLYKL